MKKRYLALLLVVALLVCAAVLTVGAETTELPAPSKTWSHLTVNGNTATGYCPHCEQTMGKEAYAAQGSETVWTLYTPSTTAHNNITTSTPNETLHYFLNEDYTSIGYLRLNTANMSLVLHLNGHTYTRNGTTAALWYNQQNTHFYIVDDEAQEGGIANIGATGNTVRMTSADTKLTLYSGNLTAAATSVTSATGNHNYRGGVVYMTAEGCEFNMYGGTVSGGNAYQGGAVYASKGTVNIHGGTIKDCKAYNRASGIYINGAGTELNMDGGIIQNCYMDPTTTSTTAYGGNLYVESGAVANIFGTAIIQNGNVAADADVTEYSKVYGGNICSRIGTVNISGNAQILNGDAQHGGNYYGENGLLHIEGGTISGGHAAGGNGGNIYIYEQDATPNTKLEIAGGTIKNGKDDCSAGPNIYVRGKSNTSMIDVDMTGGYILVDDDTTYTKNGAALYIHSYADVDITDGEIKDITTTGGGAIVSNSGDSTSLLIGGNAKITNCKGSTGGALFLNVAMPTTIEGKATISQCKGTAGGAIYMGAAATVTMTGGTIEDCSLYTDEDVTDSGKFGGSVYIANGTFDMQGGTITGGKTAGGAYNKDSTNYGGNIALVDGTLKISGTAHVTKGVSRQAGNIYVKGGTFTMNGGKVTGGLTSGYNATHAGNIWFNGGTSTISGGEISGGRASSAGGNIYPAAAGANVTVSGNAQIKDGVAANGGNINNANCTKLYLNGGTISGGKATDGENLRVQTGTVYLNGATIGAGSNDGAEESISLAQAGATLYIQSGIIENHIGTNGAILLNNATATVNMSGGTIQDCDSDTTKANYQNAQGLGGAFNVQAGTLNITGGTIQNCEASYGGAIFAKAGSVSISQAAGKTTLIDGCIANRGGSIMTTGTANLTISGGTIQNGAIRGKTVYADSIYGGNIYLEGSGTLQITDGTITGGGLKDADYDDPTTYASSTYGVKGGNIAVRSTTELSITGGEITNGFGYMGGNIYTEKGTVSISGADTVISSGKATHGGNLLSENAAATLNVGGATLSEGNATSRGGNIYSVGTLNLTGGEITDGTASTGRNLFIYGSAANLNGGTIANGGNNSVHLNGASTLNLGNVTFQEKEHAYNWYERIILEGAPHTAPDGATLTTATVNIGNFNSDVTFDYTEKSDTTAYNFAVGDELYNISVNAENVGNTGSYWVMNNSSSRIPAVINSNEDKLIVGGVTGFINDGSETGKEVPVSALGSGQYDYYKIYAGGTYTMAGNAIVDLNNQVVTINNGSYKLSPIEYRTNSGALPTTKLTVENPENLVTYTVNPIDGCQYLVVGHDEAGNVTEDGIEYYTANRISADFTKVSINPSSAGMYYTSNFIANKNLEDLIECYGTALRIDAAGNTEITAADYMEGSKYTYMTAAINGSKKLNSALLTGILAATEDELGTTPNATRAALMIDAANYVELNQSFYDVNGNEVTTIMAGNPQSFSFQSMMEAYDESLTEENQSATVPAGAINFYNAWVTCPVEGTDLMSAWTLPNIKAAATAAAAQ